MRLGKWPRCWWLSDGRCFWTPHHSKRLSGCIMAIKERSTTVGHVLHVKVLDSQLDPGKIVARSAMKAAKLKGAHVHVRRGLMEGSWIQLQELWRTDFASDDLNAI